MLLICHKRYQRVITTYDNFAIYINYLPFITTSQVKYIFFQSNQTKSYIQNQNPNLICTSLMHTVVRSNAYCKQGSVNSRSKAGTRISSTWALSKRAVMTGNMAKKGNLTS